MMKHQSFLLAVRLLLNLFINAGLSFFFFFYPEAQLSAVDNLINSMMLVQTGEDGEMEDIFKVNKIPNPQFQRLFQVRDAHGLFESWVCAGYCLKSARGQSGKLLCLWLVLNVVCDHNVIHMTDLCIQFSPRIQLMLNLWGENRAITFIELMLFS